MRLTTKTLYNLTDPIEDGLDGYSRTHAAAMKVWNWLQKQETAIAVAANQLGFTERFFVLKSAQRFGLGSPVIMNPTFKPAGGAKQVWSEESCLSFPGKTFKLRRWNKIKVRCHVAGTTQFINMNGLGAIVFQHEISHLDGEPDDVLLEKQEAYGQ